jgi:hypothetical protein
MSNVGVELAKATCMSLLLRAGRKQGHDKQVVVPITSTHRQCWATQFEINARTGPRQWASGDEN